MKISSLFKAAGIEPSEVKGILTRNYHDRRLYIFKAGDQSIRIVVNLQMIIRQYGEGAISDKIVSVTKQHNLVGRKLEVDIEVEEIKD